MEIENLLKEVKELKKLEKPCDKPYQYGNVEKKVAKTLDDIDNNRNHSLTVELINKNVNRLDNPAIKYRGNVISYNDMFTKVYTYAKSLKQMGLKKGDTIPMCIANIPEFVYLFLATNLIGCKANIVGEWFNKDYLLEIINSTNSKVMFIDDISYFAIKDSIKNSNLEKLVCFSLTDSFKNGINPYEPIDSMFHEIKNNVSEIKNDYNNLLNVKEFEKLGLEYKGNVVENVSLNDVCSITYTSGTLKPGYPKGVMHANRSYITLARFKEPDVYKVPAIKGISVLGHIPTYTHMLIACGVSDTLFGGYQLDLEPFYNKEFFPYSILINKPNYVTASVGFWQNLCKKLYFNNEFKNADMSFLMLPVVTGEGMSIGEEKFFNMAARKFKFGTAKLPFPLAPVTFSIGGGTTESSGVFTTLYKSLQEKKLNHLIKKETLGLKPHQFIETEVLDENGRYCEINEPGLLVANNPCQMLGYTNTELNKETHVIDQNGKKWLKLGTYSYKDTTGTIKMKGRMGSYLVLSDNSKLPFYKIEDTILKDTKNVMSCTVLKCDDNNIVCHIELQPFKQNSESQCIKSIISRIENEYSDEVKNQLFFRMRNNVESFPLDPSGKRSLSTLKTIGADNLTLTFNELKQKYQKQGKVLIKK